VAQLIKEEGVMEDRHQIVGPIQRSAAVKLAESKLTGERLRETVAFIRRSRRKAHEVEVLVSRLTALPDVAVPEADRARHPVTSPHQIEQIRKERAEGRTLRELAEKYNVSYTTIRRYCLKEEA
jgi:response regulator of citrate/malate metabolism